MDEIKKQLMRKAYLYADGEAYRAGVEAALKAVHDDARGPSEAEPDPPAVLAVGASDR